jgi:hypothetical protein
MLRKTTMFAFAVAFALGGCGVAQVFTPLQSRA